MRAQTKRAAEACEFAEGPRRKCACRCAGAQHGRKLRTIAPADDVLDLSDDDPHHPGNKVGPPTRRRARPWPQLPLPLEGAS